jgi:hypothetical protein
VDNASEKTSRWFVSHKNEKTGPYSWRALLALASRGDLDPEAMLIKEHSKRWVRAHTLRALFNAAPMATIADAAAPTTALLQQPQCIPASPRSAVAAARPGTREAPGVPGQRAHREALDAALTPLVMPVKELAWIETARRANPERCAASDATMESADDRQARFAVPDPGLAVLGTAEPKPAPRAGVYRSIWDAPWVMEGLAAASISVLLGVSIVAGYQVLDRIGLGGSRPASPVQQVATPVPETSK